MITRLTPFGVTDPAHWLAPCKTLVTVQGSLQSADASSLVRELRQTEKPIQFLRMVEDSPRFSAPVAKTLTPPEDMVRLDHVLNVAATEAAVPRARMEKVDAGFRVFGDPRPGGHVAFIPVREGARIDVPSWIRLRLRKGRISFLTWGNQKMITLAPDYLFRMSQPLEVGFAVPTLRNCDYIVIYNVTPGVVPEFDLLDASVLVTQEDWRKNQSVLASVR